jgi:DNA-binding FadR family transcriptional regulator
MVEAIARFKLRDVVLSRLRSYIVDGSLKPGDRLPTEAELATRFGVSRLSLREATKSLELLGIVEARPGRGLTVGHVDMNRVTDYLGFHPALQNVDPDVLIDTRLVIETGILKYVAHRMAADSSIYQRLDAINGELRQARVVQRWVELDISFHRELIAASGLPPLAGFNEVLAVFFKRFRENIKRAEWPGGIQSHQFIIDALRDGRLDDAESRLRAHIESHRHRL